ncbi:hypothetical protein Tco_1150367 [Tanacetum coccineum]
MFEAMFEGVIGGGLSSMPFSSSLVGPTFGVISVGGIVSISITMILDVLKYQILALLEAWRLRREQSSLYVGGSLMVAFDGLYADILPRCLSCVASEARFRTVRWGTPSTALILLAEAARYITNTSPLIGALLRALKNGSDLSAPFERNQLSAVSFPLRLCISLNIFGGLRSLIALTFDGLDLIPCLVMRCPKNVVLSKALLITM